MIGLTGVMCFCALFNSMQGSAIPMWEYLSRQEKTSYIYSLFATQVERFCEASSIPLCNRQLLKYGLGTLKVMEEDKLDSMDPYQRGANNIIWETLMDGHRFQKTTPKTPRKSTTSKPNSYEDESFSEYDAYGTAASARLDNVYVVPPPRGFIPKVTSHKNEQNLPEESSSLTILNILKTPDGKGVFNRFQNQYRPISVTTEKVVTSTERYISNEDHDFNHHLTGPMVVKVYLDGTPVREQTKEPQDDDLGQYELQHMKIPNF